VAELVDKTKVPGVLLERPTPPDSGVPTAVSTVSGVDTPVLEDPPPPPPPTPSDSPDCGEPAPGTEASGEQPLAVTSASQCRSAHRPTQTLTVSRPTASRLLTSPHQRWGTSTREAHELPGSRARRDPWTARTVGPQPQTPPATARSASASAAPRTARTVGREPHTPAATARPAGEFVRGSTDGKDDRHEPFHGGRHLRGNREDPPDRPPPVSKGRVKKPPGLHILLALTTGRRCT
jgi:hypothetical protein